MSLTTILVFEWSSMNKAGPRRPGQQKEPVSGVTGYPVSQSQAVTWRAIGPQAACSTRREATIHRRSVWEIGSVLRRLRETPVLGALIYSYMSPPPLSGARQGQKSETLLPAFPLPSFLHSFILPQPSVFTSSFILLLSILSISLPACPLIQSSLFFRRKRKQKRWALVAWCSLSLCLCIYAAI